MATKPSNFTVTLGDLAKILEQIKIAEIHAETGVLANLDGSPISPLLPAGLRTVDGSYNSLLPGQEQLGAADEVMPRLLDPVFINEGDDEMPLGPPGSGAPTITNNDYSLHQSVADADPRIISNLISDQTASNFVALHKALELAGSQDPAADAQALLDALAAAQLAVTARDQAQTVHDAAQTTLGTEISENDQAQSALADASTANSAAQDALAAAVAALALANDAASAAALALSAAQIAADDAASLLVVEEGELIAANALVTSTAAAAVAAEAAVAPAQATFFAAFQAAIVAQTEEDDALVVLNDAIANFPPGDPEIVSAQSAYDAAAFASNEADDLRDVSFDNYVAADNALTAAEQAASAAVVAAATAQEEFDAAFDADVLAQSELATAQTDHDTAQDALVAPQQAYDDALATAQGTVGLLDVAQLAADAAAAELLVAQEAADAAETALATADALVVSSAAVADQMPEDLGLHISSNGTLTIENLSPDIGLSPSFNSWMTLFAQFFDHGLDLIPKAGNGTVYIPLQPDDPLYVEGGPNFMAMTRAATVTTAGADGVMGTADDETHETINHTTPATDQNQTYTSHPSHQVFLREYILHPETGKPIATGHLLDGANGGLANWAETKAQARDLLGIELSDFDAEHVPLLRTDLYGNFIPGANGYAQVVVGVGADGIANTEDDVVVEGDPLNPVNLAEVGALRTGHSFLVDIAHHAVPGFYDHDGDPATAKIAQVADEDTDLDGNGLISTAEATADDGLSSTYDNELLDRHYIAGDGRGNENIGLTAVHTVFHSEHNRLVEDYKQTILGSEDLAIINEWLLVDVTSIPSTPADVEGLIWDGERLFQAGRFVTEMQYQHMVFEELARKIQPAIDPFVFSASPDLSPAILAEFAHVVYRFGHSMLTETVDRLDAQNNVVGGEHIGLIEAFLNPVEFDQDGAVTADQAVGQIVRGMSKQAGNEIDEFLTEALRNNLVGLPLDLGALNIARGRDTGVPSFNDARAQFYEATGDSRLTPYTSWTDYATHMKNPLSVINFIAAYGTHETITAATTLEGKRDAAMLLVTGGEGAPSDRLDYLNSTGAWAEAESGMNLVDFWIGGLAEEKQEFGGMLGGTFNFVFETQLENLQNGDRFYYLSRTQGMNLLNQLEGNSFAALVMRNSDLGETGQGHLPALLFDTPDATLEVVTDVQIGDDPTWGDPILDIIKPLFIRTGFNAEDGYYHFLQYNGADHIVMGGSELGDTLIGGLGIDSLWGDGGNDRLDGGYEADKVYGGDGDDIITNLGGDDFLFGDDGNDVIHMGSGVVLAFGGRGNDFVMTGPDAQEVFAGEGDDFVIGNNGGDFLLGNEGDDWLEGGEGFDTLAGENSELFFNSPIIGHDVLNGQGNDTDYDGESGDDIMFQGAGIQRSNGMAGFDWAVHKGDPNAANSDMGIPIFVNQQEFILRDRFDLVEGLSGWNYNDVLIGRQIVNGAIGANGAAAQFDVNSKFESFSNALLQTSVDRIEGFDRLVAHLDRVNVSWAGQVNEVVVMDETAVTRIDATTASFVADTAADIILGGAGSDRIEGKAGNDIIDGDAWLNAVVRVNMPNEDSFEIDSIAEIQSRMLSGEINPGQLEIVRRIELADASTDIDTAVFRDVRDNYTVTVNADLSITVQHNVVAGGGGGLANQLIDGTDHLFNIERLEFADITVTVGGANNAPVGALLIGGGAPTEDQNLFAAVQFNDPEGISPGSLVFTWQMLAQIDGVDELWVDVGTGQNFVPGDAQVGNALRVVATYTDGLGVQETVTSAATDPVIYVNDNPVGAVLIDDLTPVLTQTLNTNNTLTDADGMGVVAYQWQSSADGVTWTDIDGATGGSYTTDVTGVQLRVAASYVDGQGTFETVFSAPATAAVEAYNLVEGTEADDPVLSGTALPDRILGFGGNDTLLGGQGDDVLDGGAGDDFMLGGAGNDTYVVDSFADSVAELANGGLDTVQTNLSNYRLADNVENLVLTGADNIHGIGNNLDNVMVGNSGDNFLQGANGNDTLLGNAGNDTLNGGNGDDSMEGAQGDDLYIVQDAGDTVAEAGDEGVDQVWTTLGIYSLTENVETLRFLGAGTAIGTGNDLDNRIFGRNGNDVLDGGTGDDWLQGGLGNDTYFVDSVADVVRETTNAGVDTVYSTTDFALGINVENLTLTSNVAATLVGNGLDNVIAGGEGGDELYGRNGNDTLIGGAGNDTINGGAGNDVIVFGPGNDTVMGFDANPVNGQDMLDLTSIGITAATFATQVSISQTGSDTLVAIGTDSVTLVGINAGTVSQGDFLLA
jgi:Ca2+-binding RTX toxin-like protein